MGTAIAEQCTEFTRRLDHAFENDHARKILKIRDEAFFLVPKTGIKSDARLSVLEVLRRSERCLGLAIRKGQAEGRIAKHGAAGGGKKIRATSFSDLLGGDGRHNLMKQACYPVTDDVTNDRFEFSIKEGKAERNLSRSNVIRHATGKNLLTDRWKSLQELADSGYTSGQIAKQVGVGRAAVISNARKHNISIKADVIVGKVRNKFDHNRILRSFVSTLESLVPSISMIDLATIDRDVLIEALSIMDDSMPELNRLRKQMLKEKQKNGQSKA